MKTFEIGKTYSTRSICDHDCVWSFEVISRTAKTVTVKRGDEIIRRRIIKSISEWRDAESIMPFGNHSMAPIISADCE